MTNDPFETAAALGTNVADGPSSTAVRSSTAASALKRESWDHWLARAEAIWEPIEARLLWLSDWLNPILVKETRQALKSWQFALTFVLLLGACWVVTIGGVSLIGPSIYYAAGGGEMLLAYYFILALPLLVVVPFAAFRSLAAEREDNTYDLLSITTLRPRQIISGKLGSAVVQMAVFFSAITPCLAFTYLLRGVDLPTIAALLAYTFFASLGLSMIGLLLATLSKQRYGQLVLSVAFVALLLVALSFAMTISTALVQNGGVPFDDPDVWVAHLAFGTFYVTTFALAYLAAAGMITFATDNRSTPLRIAMLVQQACWIGWMGVAWIADSFRPGFIFAMAVAAGCYWYVAGTMLTSERPELSHRVRRRLPTSSLGRAVFGWLNPGPVSGYMFVIANLTSILVISLIGSPFSDWTRSAAVGSGTGDLFCYLFIGWGYVVAYLGLGLLLITLIRRVAVVSMLGCVLVQVLLLMAGSGIPVCIQLMAVNLRERDYSYLQVTNPIWTMAYLSDMGRAMAEVETLVFIVPAAAMCVLLLNFPALVREVRRVRVALPARVAIDEAELHPEPVAGPTNPWDVADPTS